MKLENQTPFAAANYVVQDADGIDMLLLVVKATYDIHSKGAVSVSEKQNPPEATDLYHDTPENSGLKYSSDITYGKSGTDIALIGHAYPPGGRATESGIMLRVGALQKNIRVFGDRYWRETAGFLSKTKPAPYERMPILYDLAYGGEDKSHDDPEKHEAEPRNLIGIGFRAKKSRQPVSGMKLPNFEDPDDLIKNPGSRPKPAGFGFISPMWEPRIGHAGTYDEDWKNTRMPLLPNNFNTKFFNSAHPDLIYRGFLKGNEPVMLSGVTEQGSETFSLPGISLNCAVEMAGGSIHELEMKMDKLVLNADDRKLIMVWNDSLKIVDDYDDFKAISCRLS